MTTTRPALKEWGAVAHALADGRQTLLLRKGGIAEKRFEVGASRFLLFPTVAHSHAASVRPEHQDVLTPGAADVADDAVTVRLDVEVVAALPVVRTEEVETLEEFHIWTSESVRRSRIDFRPRHLLTALVVRARVLETPVALPRHPDQVGCFSWLDVAVGDLPARQVVDDTTLDEVAAEVRRRVG